MRRTIHRPTNIYSTVDAFVTVFVALFPIWNHSSNYWRLVSIAIYRSAYRAPHTIDFYCIFGPIPINWFSPLSLLSCFSRVFISLFFFFFFRKKKKTIFYLLRSKYATKWQIYAWVANESFANDACLLVNYMWHLMRTYDDSIQNIQPNAAEWLESERKMGLWNFDHLVGRFTC